MEGTLRFDSNWGASYGSQELHRSSGLFKYFGVPVWDGGQHLGIRMPNLSANYTLHPIVFVGVGLNFTIDCIIRAFRNCRIVLCGGPYFYFVGVKELGLIIIFLNFCIIWSNFYFLVHNDYSVMVGTFSGVFTLITILVDKALYKEIWATADFNRITAKLVFVFSSIVTGHPRGFFIAFPLVLIISIKFFNFEEICSEVTS